VMDCQHGATVTIDRIVLCDICIQAARLEAAKAEVQLLLDQVDGNASWRPDYRRAIIDWCDRRLRILDGGGIGNEPNA